MNCKVSTEWDGKRRTLFEHMCACGKSFWRPKHRSSKYCSNACAAQARQTKLVVTCAQCGSQFERSRNKLTASKHGVLFCSRKCKDTAQSLTGLCPEIRPSHYGTSNDYRNFKKSACEDCSDVREYLLVVHHKDGDRSNNVSENLETVCPTCHVKRHLCLTESGWVVSFKHLTPRHLLVEL